MDQGIQVRLRIMDQLLGIWRPLFMNRRRQAFLSFPKNPGFQFFFDPIAPYIWQQLLQQI